MAEEKSLWEFSQISIWFHWRILLPNNSKFSITIPASTYSKGKVYHPLIPKRYMHSHAGEFCTFGENTNIFLLFLDEQGNQEITSDQSLVCKMEEANVELFFLNFSIINRQYFWTYAWKKKLIPMVSTRNHTFRTYSFNPIYKTTKVCLMLPFFSETAPPILMKLGIHFIHSLKMVLKLYGLILPINKKLSHWRQLKLRVNIKALF